MKTTFSHKLRAETKRYHSSVAVVIFVIFVTITLFLIIVVIKGLVDNKKNQADKPTSEASSKELNEVKVEPQIKEDTKYTVKAGDTLYGIGIKFGINWQEIAKTNDLGEPYTLSTGQELKIPKGSSNKK